MADPKIQDNLENRPPPLSRRERWASKFENWPLIRLMIYSPPFLITVMLFLGGLIAVGLALPKMWRTTPAGFVPEVKISLIDYWQVRSLRRAARSAEERGEMKAAFEAWRASWANNVADETSLRGLLAIIPKLDDSDDAIGAALQGGYWLLRTGGTNTADLELIARAWVNTRTTTLSDRAAAMLDSQRSAMPESLERLYLMALFQASRTAEFGRRIRSNPQILAEVEQHRLAATNAVSAADSAFPEVRSREPRFEFYCLAYLLGWGDDADRLSARERLRLARQNRTTEHLAFDLEFLTMFHLRDAEACGALLREMQDVGADTIRHHVGYWGLLVYHGRKAQAEQLAQASNFTPKNGFEAFRLAEAFTQLGMAERASDLITRYTDTSGWAAELLVLESELLIRAGNWDGLRSLALRIQMMPQAVEYLGGYGAYLEGLASWRSGDRANAEPAFAKAVTNGVADPRIALRVGEGLTSLGGVRWAQPILLAHREALKGSPEYLRLLVKVGAYLKEGEDMLSAAEELYRQQPSDPVAVNNYAAALMIFRQKPQEAIELASRLLVSYPNSPAVVANYAAALAMMGRYPEAEMALKEVNISRFDAAELAQYYLTYFEIALMTDRRADARRYLRLIDKAQLYPAQVTWLDDAAKRLGPAPTEATSQ